MGQINIDKGNFKPTINGKLGYSFDENGNPVRVNEDGTVTLIPLETNAAIKNVIANLGIGTEANLPTVAIVQGDIYVTNDTYKVFTRTDDVSWSSVDLIKLQFITDDSQSIKELWQYNDTTLIFLARGEILDLSKKENISTGISYGGAISINAGDDSLFDITAGQAIIVNSYTDPENPVFTTLTWTAQVGLSVTNIGTQLITFVSLEDDGAGNPIFTQSATPQTVEDNRDKVGLGVLVHTNLANITNVSDLANWNKDTDLKILDLAGALQRINIDGGNRYSANGVNLQINKSEGSVFAINANSGNNKKVPNTIVSEVEVGITFLTVYGDAGSQIGQTNLIDTANYNPLGAGGLVAMPTDSVTTHGIFFSPETGLTIVHYGQFLYDTLKEAIDAWEAEKYNIVPELEGVSVMGVLAFVAGATDLSNPTQAKFIQPGAFGILPNTTTEEYSRYAGEEKILSGMSYKQPTIVLIESGGVIYAEVERIGGGDFICVFGEREYVLDCTTGAGTGGKARIALTAGTASVTQKNYVYATPTAGNGHAQLNSSINRPTGEFAYIFDCALKDAAYFLLYGAISPRRWSDAKEFNGRSSIARTNERIRVLPAEYESGLLQTFDLSDVATEDEFSLTTIAGEGWQKHLQSIPALASNINNIYIANHPTVPFLPISSLRSVESLQTASGDSLSDTRFNWGFALIAGMTDADCKLIITLPTDSYATDSGAVDDPNGTAVSSFEKNTKGTILLIGKVAIRHRTTGAGTYQNLTLDQKGLQLIDWRGQSAGVSGGAASPTPGSSFEDALFNVYNVLAGFQFRFDAVNLLGNRIVTMPNISGLMAVKGMLEAFTFGGQAHAGSKVETFSATKTFNLNNGSNQYMSVSANTVLTLSNKLPGTYIIQLQNTVLVTSITVDSTFGNPVDNNPAFLLTSGGRNKITVHVDANNNTEYLISTTAV